MHSSPSVHLNFAVPDHLSVEALLRSGSGATVMGLLHR